jgi:ATP-dependent helicase/nuclease subunit B
MPTRLPRVYTIAPGGDFLSVLADHILGGFPLTEGEARPPLSHWTILLPTRRASRALAKILLQKSKMKALLLPRIRPIGDLDEEGWDPFSEHDELPPAISETGQLFVLITLLRRWATENPLIGLAQEIIASPAQSLALATSLKDLIDQLETEELNFENLGEIYEGELSEHRDAILSLLSIIRFELPKCHIAENCLGKAQRRSLAIRAEAKKIAASAASGPIVAAGSTGTIPATRALLLAISQHPQGAVILPGLDQHLGDEAWDSLKSDHPQFSLRMLLAEFRINRSDVKALSKGNAARVFLTSEVMRPTESTDQWREILGGHGPRIAQAMENLNVLEAPDRHMEARSIALILRHTLETPGQTAALMTPDRDLAKRVRVELLRWNIIINDSAGVPLTSTSRALIAQLMIEAVREGFSPASVLALLHHPECQLGFEPSLRLRAVHNLEMAVLRNYDRGAGLANLDRAVSLARLAHQRGERAHPQVARLSEDDWQTIQLLVSRLKKALAQFENSEKQPFANQCALFQDSLKQVVMRTDEAPDDDQAFNMVMDEIRVEAHRLPPTNFHDAAMVILGRLHLATVHEEGSTHPRLAIYGLLEARMMPVDILIMGGLNETKWPAQSDPGPWLNRTMRDKLGLQQPERSIGLSGHDFAQGLGVGTVYLTYAKRVEAAPVVPSRWILRLRAVLQTSGIDPQLYWDKQWLKLAQEIDAADTLRPHGKPKPTPPVQARPNRISVTEVEKLIRDPYAVYARRILRLEPLSPLARPADAALRGTIFHAAVNHWNKLQMASPSNGTLEHLLKAAEAEFAPYMANEDIAAFWWPAFVRMAHWLVTEEAERRQGLHHMVTETAGELHFDVAGTDYTLHGRADRIDVLANGQARIVDYKTGTPPTSKQVTSGLSPQLPLEAAILLHGQFERLEKYDVQSLAYIHIGGGKDVGYVETITPTDGTTLSELVARQLKGLKDLVTSYMSPTQTYLPRVAIEKEEDTRDYDHLSRFREWMLAGDAK